MKWHVWIERLSVDPLNAIEWVVSICAFIGAFYFVSPFYTNLAHPSPLTTVLTHPLMVWTWGGVMLIGTILVIIGLCRGVPGLRAPGWFMVFLARLYQTLATLIVVGPVPLQWILPFTLSLIVLVLWANARGEVR